jgi:hypothetical protein
MENARLVGRALELTSSAAAVRHRARVGARSARKAISPFHLSAR